MFGLIRTTIIALVLAFNAGSILAQDFQKGVAAYHSGDYATALREWRPLAEQGDASAQTNLGLMYDRGLGVPQDYAEAMKWYRLAAEQGEVSAQFNLGLMYDRGLGVPQDYAEAMKWYRLAAEQGDASAQTNLGLMYDIGLGVLQDNVMAYMWYNIAAANGHKEAGKWRDERAGLMTSADISKAQSMARECMSSNYKNCGW
jgi:uncharacterized protein